MAHNWPPGNRAVEELLAALRDLRDGDFRRRLVLNDDDGVAELATVFNELAERNQSLVAELADLREAVAGGQWPAKGVATAAHSGGWLLARESVNGIFADVARPIRELKRVLDAAADGDLTRRLSTSDAPSGDLDQLGEAVNRLLDRLSGFTSEITRVVTETGFDGRLGARARVSDLSGAWRETTDAVNAMSTNLADQVRDLAHTVHATGQGDLTRKSTVTASGDVLELRNTVNAMVDRFSALTHEITRVAHEVASEGRLGSQADVPSAAGTWRGVVRSVNFMADNLTGQVHDIARVAKAVANGDLSQKVDVDARGEILELKNTINTMVGQLSAFADEVTRVAREVGTEGKLGGQARVPGVGGIWKSLTDNVNVMADNLTSQVRSIATVATAVASGDLSKKVTVEARGEVAALADTINQMVETLRAFADQVTFLAHEVGTEGVLGGQARVPNVAGTWKDLTDNVNIMARNLTSQVRDIAQVTTAVAGGDLSKKIDVDAHGEILELKTTINTMVDRLSSFASEVTRVAREVGTEGKLGGQAEVIGVSGTWERLTDRVNHLAGNLTTQVRAIAAVATAVTNGDLTRQITVDASGEVAELKDNINQMIDNLQKTTRSNEEQNWLKTNLAKISGLMQGKHKLPSLASITLSELAPLVSAQYATFFLVQDTVDGPVLERIASYGTVNTPSRFALGESLIGQATVEKETIVVTEAPPDHIRISSGLGSSAPLNMIVLPLLFEDRVLGVIELASVNTFTRVHFDLLEQLKETIGVNVNTILANSRTEALLSESQHLAEELRTRSEQLQRQQEELRYSNTELEEKAALLASRNRDIEVKNIEIEQARQQLEERARQLALASKYKSEFLANMSHELRTPLNSALLLAKLLADNPEGNLTPQQVDLAKTINSAGSDLLDLINDVLDLAKIEAGHMELIPQDVELGEIADRIESLYRPLAVDKGLNFTVSVSSATPPTVETDKNRLEQVLRNLLSNAVKFTDEGSVRLSIRTAEASEIAKFATHEDHRDYLAFVVQDTGIGIERDKIPYIFEAFHQVDGTTIRKYGGTGLGLSISRELTSLLGGDLHVESTLQQGSTFTLYLPIKREREPSATESPSEATGNDRPLTTDRDPSSGPTARLAEDGQGSDAPTPGEPEPETQSQTAASSTEHPAVPGRPSSGQSAQGVEPEASASPRVDTEVTQFHGETVLLVDDDQRGVIAMTALLEQHGLRVLQADNGVSGLRMLRHHNEIQVVLMDLMMPELDGTATIAAIRDMPEFRGLPVITVTAKAMRQDREKSLSSGATDHVTKPVDAARLLRLLEHYLDKDIIGE